MRAETKARDIPAERADIDRVVAGKTVCTIFADAVARHPQQPALHWPEGSTWQTLTWGEYAERVQDLTLALLSLGFGPGQHGLIMARNVPEHLIADLALVHAGGTAISIYNTLAPEQVHYIAHHSEATVAFVEDESFLQKFLTVRNRLPRLQRVVLIRGSSEDPWIVSWQRLLAEGAASAHRDPAAFTASWQRVRPEDVAALIYTSGTTGPPKGVMYTHRNLVWTLESARRILELEPERLVSYLPLAHVAERFTSHWGAIYNSHQVYFCPDPAQLLPTLLHARPTVFVGVPRVWEKFQAAITAGIAAEPDETRRNALQSAIVAARRLLSAREAQQEVPPELETAVERARPLFAALRAKLGLDQCRYAITSTAPLPRDVMEFFTAIGLPLHEVWGMSELTGPATAIPADGFKMSSVGLPLPGVEVKLAEDGEILVRGGNVMLGYYKEPEKTAETVDPEGWVHSGDVGELDADGYLRLIDRKKELIITSGGKNVSPAWLEGLMKHNPLIGQAVAVGDGRKFISALIVLDSEVLSGWAAARGIPAGSPAELTQNPLVVEEVRRALAEVNEQLSRAEQIRRFTILPTEWTAESEELTPTLKLRRRVIDRKYAAEIEAMYADPPGGHPVEVTPALSR